MFGPVRPECRKVPPYNLLLLNRRQAAQQSLELLRREWCRLRARRDGRPVAACAACDSEPVCNPGRLPVAFRCQQGIGNRRLRAGLLSGPRETPFSQPDLVHSFRVFDEEHEQALDASDRLDALNKLVGGSFLDQVTE